MSKIGRGARASRTVKPAVVEGTVQIHAPEEVRSSKFNIENLTAIAHDLKSGRITMDRITITDNIVTGLRAIVRSTGGITYHVNYAVDGVRPYMKIGDHAPGTPDHIDIPTARKLAKVVQELGRKGIDPQDGLLRRLVKELLAKGTDWRPS